MCGDDITTSETSLDCQHPDMDVLSGRKLVLACVTVNELKTVRTVEMKLKQNIIEC